MKILFLSGWLPFPANNGSKLRIHNLLHCLSQHHDVTLLSFADQPEVDLGNSEIRSLCCDLHIVPWRPFQPRSQRAQLGFFSSKPRFLADTYSPQMNALIQDSVATNHYDLVIASQLLMASYYPSLRGLPAMFEEVELGLFHDNAFYARSLYKRLRLGLTWSKLQKYLAHVLQAFRVCTVASERERQLFAVTFPKHRTKVKVIPNCIAVKEYRSVQAEPVPFQLIFSGSFRYYANHEAMQWFLREVFPGIVQRLPAVRLVITGDHAGLQLPSAPNITLTGHLQNIKPLIAASRVSIVPLLIGGGTRLKILEAMALGTPVVSTSKGAEGLDAIPGKHLLLGDSPTEFAEKVIRILEDRDLHHQLSVNACQFVERKYDCEIVMPRFLQLVEEAAC